MSILHRVLTTATLLLAVMLIITISVDAQTITSSGLKGNWSSPTTWVGGVLPGPSNTVQIAAGDSVGVDTNFVITNLIVGEATGAASRLRLNGNRPLHFTINGNLTVNTGSQLTISNSTWDDPNVTGTVNEIVDTLLLSGNFTSTGKFDLSTGSAGTTKHNVRIILVGTGNSTITCGAYGPTTSDNEFSGFTIRKTGSGRVILANDIYTYGGSSSSAAHINPYNYFESGLVEAINGAFISVWTDNNAFRDYSASSYVIGTVGRGVSNGGTGTKEFPVGDEFEYRPVSVRTTTAGSATGHHVLVTAIRGNANNGSSTFSPSIDKVSSVRYYKVGYNKTWQGADFIGVDRFKLSYGKDEGIGTGNVDLRIAKSTDRALWTGLMQTVDDTTFIPDAAIQDSTLADTLNAGEFFYLALARLATTTTNTLVFSTSVEDEATVPSAWVLGQNYPNPFNPVTRIEYWVPGGSARSAVSLVVYDVRGARVRTLVQGTKASGRYAVDWDGRNDNGTPVSSGVYFYRMTSGGFADTRRMVLLK